MLEFKPITIDDREEMMKYMGRLDLGTTESTFTDIFLWSEHYNTRFCIKNGFLFIKSGENYLTPYGDGNIKEALEMLPKDANFICVHERNLNRFLDAFPDRFEVREMRDSFDYIYSSEELINLTGKKFHKKRTNVNNFLKNYEYEFVEITKENLPEIAEFQKFWLEKNINPLNEKSLMGENAAISRAFSNFEALGLKCGAIKIDGRVRAYSYGVPINDDFFLICVEKADTDFTGIYQVINRDFAAHFCKNYKFINREEDLGDEGLRRAKLSYNPAYLSKKYMITSKG